jgi:hypothetical protein
VQGSRSEEENLRDGHKILVIGHLDEKYILAPIPLFRSQPSVRSEDKLFVIGHRVEK